MAKTRLHEAVEQWLGHFVVLGLVLGYLLGPLAPAAYLVRELTKLKIGRWKIGQWPPGDLVWIGDQRNQKGELLPAQWHTQLARVLDMRKDLIFTFAGYELAQLAREITIWRLF